MDPAPAVLVIDDGELDDVIAILAELDVPYRHLRGAGFPEPVELPGRLVVTTGRRALTTRWGQGAERGDSKGVRRIAVCKEDSRSVRTRLRTLGFHYVVRRPVHLAALRLLLLHVLYSGPERRASPRVPIGAAVLVRSRIRKWPAVLAELSTGGCRLFANVTYKPGARIHVQLPPALAGGRAFSLKGRVVRCESRRSVFLATDSEIGVRFEGLGVDGTQKIRELMRERESGAASVGGAAGPDVQIAPAPTPSRAATRGERRKAERRPYTRRVIALGEEAAQVVMGRDFSATGMGIDWREGVAVGDRLRIAVYAEPGTVPIVLPAEVVRVDRRQGIGLRFEKVADEAMGRLEEILSVLPPIEPLDADENQALGTVMSKILPPDPAGGES